MPTTLEDLMACMQRIETKLDVLIGALAEEGDGELVEDLDGLSAGGARDQGQPL